MIIQVINCWEEKSGFWKSKKGGIGYWLQDSKRAKSGFVTEKKQSCRRKKKSVERAQKQLHTLVCVYI